MGLSRLNMCEIDLLLAYICTDSSLEMELIPILHREWFCGRLMVREVVNTNVWYGWSLPVRIYSNLCAFQ